MDEDSSDGFTLIELLVVVVIIGILAGIAIPALLAQRRSGWQAQLTSDVRNAILDVEAEFVNNGGEYPTQAEFINNLSPITSDPAISFTYTTNTGRDEFCVLGEDTRQPVGNQRLAHYVSGSGVQVFQACPPFTNP